MLYLVATPIGNLDDLTPRAVQVLKDSDIIACEDTRRTRILLAHYDIPYPGEMVSYREQTEQRRGEYLAQKLENGLTVALCTDGGYPGISDPGYRLLRLAVKRELDFQVIPGAGAVSVALLASGLSSSSYTFKGFPPRKRGAMERFFLADKDMPHTQVFFESPVRIQKCLEVALEALGDREAAVCIELTKKFERVSRGYLSNLLNEFTDRKVKGEVTIVIAGNNSKFCRNSDSDTI